MISSLLISSFLLLLLFLMISSCKCMICCCYDRLLNLGMHDITLLTVVVSHWHRGSSVVFRLAENPSFRRSGFHHHLTGIWPDAEVAAPVSVVVSAENQSHSSGTGSRN